MLYANKVWYSALGVIVDLVFQGNRVYQINYCKCSCDFFFSLLSSAKKTTQIQGLKEWLLAWNYNDYINVKEWLLACNYNDQINVKEWLLACNYNDHINVKEWLLACNYNDHINLKEWLLACNYNDQINLKEWLLACNYNDFINLWMENTHHKHGQVREIMSSWIFSNLQ